MIFEKGDQMVIAPLDPKQGKIYVEPVREEVDAEGLDTIYKMPARTKDYINPTTYGNLSWQSINSCSSDSEEGLEN